MRTILLVFCFLLSATSAFSQEFYQLRGFVYSESNEPIPGVTVRVVNAGTGTITDKDGRYQIKLLEGLNRISVSSMGYQTEVFEVVAAKNLVKNVFLKIDQKQLDEVVVKVKKKDYSYEVIKHVLQRKDSLLNQYQNYRAKAYIKSVERLETKKVAPKKDDDTPAKVEDALKKPVLTDSIPKLNLFECQLIRHQSRTGQQKEEREAVKRIGDQSTLFFKSVTDGEFNLYQNHQKIAKIGDNEITSPLSDLTFLSYRFQLLKYYIDGPHKIYQIKVIPRELGNALYEGTVEVIEDEWVLRNVDLQITKRGLLRYDEFGVKQQFELVQGRWIPTRVTYHWKVKEGNTKKAGKTEVLHSDYAFDLTLPKRFFGDEVGVTTAEAYKRDTTFWEQIRPQPLTKDEQKFIKERERLEALVNSKAYLDSIDKIFNRITFPKVVYLGIGHINREKKMTWHFDPVLGLVDPLAIGGWRVRYGAGFYKRQENRKQLWFNSNLGYGFKNKDVIGFVNVSYFYNPLKVSNISLSMGSGFNVINGAATISDIARRSNFYRNQYINLTHRTELFNGFYFSAQAYYETRRDLSNFQFSSLGDRIFSNNAPQPFPTTHIYRTVFGIEYTPRQLYLREPNEKVILGSNYPTFGLNIDRAWPVSGKNTNVYTKLSVSIRQTFNVGIIGTSEYRISAGKFLDTTSLAVMDYSYMRGGDRYFFSPAMYTYQLIPQTFPVFNWHLETHYVHQFNGFLTSKIPFLNKTKIREMAGGGFLYVPERKFQYSELYFGLNRIFKIGRERIRLGAYYVIGQSNTFGVSNGVKFSIEPYNAAKNTWSF